MSKNTIFEFMYRDADNYKIHSEAILKGEMTDEDYNTIISCLDENTFFIPAQVGLEGERFATETEADHPWFEVTGYRLVPDTVKTCGIAVQELVERFKAVHGHWDPDY